MAQYGGFFNSSDTKKRQYVDLDFARIFSLFTGNQGFVAGYLDELEVLDATDESGIKVNVKAGAAWIGEPAGWWYINDDVETLELDNNELAQDETRTDRVVLELNRSTDELKVMLKIKKGPPEVPILKSFEETEGRVQEISLANIVVTGESPDITITDERSSEYCGVIRLGGISTGAVGNAISYDSISPIKAGDDTAGNLLSYIEENSRWEKQEFGQPYDGTNLILPGGIYNEIAAFTGVIGKRLYRQLDGKFSTNVRKIEYYIGYSLDANTALIGVLGGVDNDYIDNMEMFYIIPGKSGTFRVKAKLPDTADNFMLRYKTTPWEFGDTDESGILIADNLLNYIESNVWFEATGLTDGEELYVKAFPSKNGTYNIFIGENEHPAKVGGLILEYTMDSVVGSLLEDTVGSRDGNLSGISFQSGKIGNEANFSGSDRITFPSLNLIGDFTILFWGVIDSGTSLNRVILSNGTADTSPFIGNYASSFVYANRYNEIHTRSISYGTRYMFEVDREYSSSQTRLRLNGDEGTTSGYDSNMTLNSMGLLYSGGANQYFDGKIDQLRIYSRLLKDYERSALYNDGNGC